MKKKATVIFRMLAVVCILGLAGCDRTPEDISKWKAQGKVQKLIGALNDENQSICEAAAIALGDLKAASAIDSLAGLITHSNPNVVLAAVEALVSIHHPSTEPHLLVAMDFKTRKTCVVAINGLGALKSTRAIEPLIKKLNALDDQVASAAATALGLINDKKAVTPLCDKVQSQSYSLRFACVKSLGSLGGEEAAAGLSLALGDINKGIRSMANEALMADNGSAISHALVSLRDENAQIRLSAVDILKAADVVPSAGSDLVWYWLAQIPTDKDSGVNQKAVARLGEMGSDATEALLEAVACNIPTIREHAFRALEIIGEPCLLQAVEAVEAHAGLAGKQWFDRRISWAGAPSWRLDLWGAATALNPSFKLNSPAGTGLQSEESILRNLSALSFKASREYIPLLIGSSDKTTASTNAKIDVFGVDVQTTHKIKDWKITKKQLVAAGDLAVFPLIAALEDNHGTIADSCAEVLGDIGDKRAVLPLAEVLSRKIEAKEELTRSPFYTALQKLGDPATESLLLKVRPNAIQATHLFERTYPEHRVTHTKGKNIHAGGTRPVTFQLGYLKDGKIGKWSMVFKKNSQGDWKPDPPLPAELP